MTALIIEDSRLARVELKNLLKKHPEIELLGEAVNAEEGQQMIERLAPDLVFLDIQMPGRNAFELLEALDQIPMVIFTTAFDEYALKSFEFNALDYLLKPIGAERLALAIGKALEKNTWQSPKKNILTEESQVFVKNGDRCWIVKLEKVRLL